MGNELLVAEKRLLVAREATYNTDQIAIEVAADNPLRYEAFTQIDVAHNRDFRERNILRPAHGLNRGQQIPKNTTFTLAGMMPLPATPGDAPLGLDNLLVAAGMTEALVDDTTATYAFSSSEAASLTLYHWMRFKDTDTFTFTYGTGGKANVQLAGSIRDWCTFNSTVECANYPLAASETSVLRAWSDDLAWFDMSTGELLLDKDGDALVGYTPDESTDDPNGLLLHPSSVLTIGGTAYRIRSFSIDFGVVLNLKEVTSASAQLDGVWIVGRGVKGSFELYNSGADWKAAKTALENNAEAAATLVLVDGLGSGGTTVTLTWEGLQFEGIESMQDVNNLAAHGLTFRSNTDWDNNPMGDTELTLVYSVTS